ncbi:MAG: hypothetical protein ONB44_13705 [candidate division KSB1 bacterium]|nr:hypothetical protein [candidate division KSB1 bacterium]MDZ7303179.1 hypothetical protein [candidate division KSB1 bacterium]MDZ7310158.1 hypothetical protein [candidate division KSB1 bacterium]
MQAAPGKLSKNGKKAMLLEMLTQLPQKEQIEIHHLLGLWLNKNSTKTATARVARARENEFLQTEFGQYILEEADAKISIEKVRNALSKISGSLAQEIIEAREER